MPQPPVPQPSPPFPLQTEPLCGRWPPRNGQLWSWTAKNAGKTKENTNLVFQAKWWSPARRNHEPWLKPKASGPDIIPLMTHRLGLAPHRLLHRFRHEIVQIFEPIAKSGIPWVPPSKTIANHLVYPPEMFLHRTRCFWTCFGTILSLLHLFLAIDMV